VIPTIEVHRAGYAWGRDPTNRDSRWCVIARVVASQQALATFPASSCKTEEQAMGGHDVDKFDEPWRTCPSCHQAYQNDLVLDLAAEFLTFVEGKYPGDQWKHLEALFGRLGVLMAIQPKQNEEAKEIANKMISMIGQMKTTNMSLSPILAIEAAVYNFDGCNSVREETKEGAKTAVEHFEKVRDICKAIGYVPGVDAAENNIALLKPTYGGGRKVSDVEYLAKRQKWYKESVQRFGESAQTTIETGMNLAFDLCEANRAIEGEMLVTKLAAMCKRVHGPARMVSPKRLHGISNFVKCGMLRSNIKIKQKCSRRCDTKKIGKNRRTRTNCRRRLKKH